MTLQDLETRVARLEASNRRLRTFNGALLALPLLAVAGWQSAPGVADIVRTKRLEIVDERGVPLVALGKDPQTNGGSVVLRDPAGEKRGWWQITNGGAVLGMAGDPGSDQGGAGIGLSAGGNEAQLSITGRGGAGATASVNADQPRLELWDRKGAPLFTAPWKK